MARHTAKSHKIRKVEILVIQITNDLLEIGLRLDYWDKLQKEFDIIQNMPLQNRRFDGIKEYRDRV